MVNTRKPLFLLILLYLWLKEILLTYYCRQLGWFTSKAIPSKNFQNLDYVRKVSLKILNEIWGKNVAPRLRKVSCLLINQQ